MAAGFLPLWAGALPSEMMVWDACADVVVGHLVDRHARPDMLWRLIWIGADIASENLCADFTEEVDREFHLTIAAATGNAGILRAIDYL